MLKIVPRGDDPQRRITAYVDETVTFQDIAAFRDEYSVHRKWVFVSDHPRLPKFVAFCSSHRTNEKGCDLTFAQFAAMGAICMYCGGPATGLDRLDNNIGYLLANVKPACGLCNRMKYAMTLQAFVSHVQKIAKHYKDEQTHS